MAESSTEPEPQAIDTRRPAEINSVAFWGFRRTKECMD
ncbi:hypothetical protein PLANPX_3839 [Lacipirellula parvula]|uniref:Uncharacterized protein n=1 Tax=Lacipirellula parvula TaxID=2650471 RepID=A0A5K7XDU4_9BACT|nr:hypothetical protein PLANPX_3839 [Lacipirellula parvula]